MTALTRGSLLTCGRIALLVVLLTVVAAARPKPAAASIISDACSGVGDVVDGIAGKACDALSSPKKLLDTGKNLVTGHVGKAVKSILGGGGGSSASTASTALGLAAIVAWVVAGSKFALTETTKIIGDTTSPSLRTTWFSATYWRIAGIAALLTLPFLFAAAVQALLQSDLSLLARAVLGYLPLAMLAIAIAAPVTMLLLAATDQLCAVVTSASGAGGPHFDLDHALLVGTTALTAPFLLFLVAVTTTAGAIAVWLELAIREAAVYVIVLMLPLAFAAFVWPARRIWVRRSVELLVALILSKLAIVAVLELGSAALDQLGHHGLDGLAAGLAGTVLVLMAAFSPWAVLRLVPLSELAHGAVGSFRPETAAQMQQVTGEQRPGALLDSFLRSRASNRGSGDESDTAVDGAGRRGAEAEQSRLDEPTAEGVGQTDPHEAAAEATDPLGGEAAAAPAQAGAAPAEPAEPNPPEPDTPPTAAGRGPISNGHRPGRALNPEFMAPNYSMPPLELNPDADWSSPNGSSAATNGATPATGPDSVNADDHEPRPPKQEDEGGPL